MDEDLKSKTGEFYGGVEPVEVGNLEDVKEQKTLIPATKNVLFRIKDAEVRVSQDNTWRSINLQLQIVNGIDSEGKYKNKVVFSNVAYYADPHKYTKDFFKTKQHLIPLKMLRKAVEDTLDPIDGHTPERLIGKLIKGDITIRSRKLIVEGVEEVSQENDVRYFKPVPLEEQV
ncbi:MAG: hypothetical protein WC444_07070 [Candidatus Paceibacterota bacterium]